MNPVIGYSDPGINHKKTKQPFSAYSLRPPTFRAMSAGAAGALRLNRGVAEGCIPEALGGAGDRARLPVWVRWAEEKRARRMVSREDPSKLVISGLSVSLFFSRKPVVSYIT